MKLNKLLVTLGAGVLFLTACEEVPEDATENTAAEEADVEEETESAEIDEAEEEDTTETENSNTSEDTSSETVEEDSTNTSSIQEDETVTAVEWVKEHEGKNIDKVIADFEALTDATMKEEIGTQVADEETSFYGKEVVVTGTATEFAEGSNGYDKGSFVVETDGGNSVRVSASSPNDALDIGEKVEVTGSLAIPLGKTTNYFVREASVYIQ